MKRINVYATLFVIVVAATTSSSCARPGEGGTTQDTPPVAVEAAVVGRGEMDAGIEVVGTLGPKRFADVKSEYSGVVTEVYVTEWVRVRKGTPLARLDVREANAVVDAARAALLQAEVAEARSRREMERARRLESFGLITGQSLDEARSANEAAAAATAAARAQLEMAETRVDKAVIRAPIDGAVALRAVNIGDRVENMGGGDPLFRIVDTRVLELTVMLSSSHLSRVEVGQALEFRTDAVPDRTFTGTVMFVNPIVDAGSRSAKLLADVPNPDGRLRGGLFVKGYLRAASRASALQIPRSALLDWNPATRQGDVFVVTGPHAERRAVRTGIATAQAVEIAGGLSAGERVVTRGAFNLKNGDRVKVVATGQGA